MARPHGAADDGTRFVAISSAMPFARVLQGGSLLPAPPPAVPLHVGSAAAAAGQPGGAAAAGGGGGGSFVETPLWLYIDAQGKEQGPFAASQVMAWAQARYLPPETSVRHVMERGKTYRPLSSVPQLGGVAPAAAAGAAGPGGGEVSVLDLDAAAAALPDAQAQEARRLDKILGPGASRVALLDDSPSAPAGPPPPAGLAPTALAPGQYKEYTAAGGFSTTTGRFTPQEMAGDNYWASKGIPNDRAGRMMNHYFDIDSWQADMNARKAPKKKARTGW